MHNKKPLIVISAIISILVSLFVGGYSFFLCILKNYWFIPIAIYYIFEGIFTLIATVQKDEYKRMRILGIFQVVNVIFMMCYLLVMMLWNDSGTMIFFNSFIVYGGALLIKLILYLVNSIVIKKEYDVTLHAFRNNEIISVMYLVNIIVLIAFKVFHPSTDELYIFIVEIIVNAVLTVLASFFALSTIIRSKTHEPLTPGEKIKHTIKWFNDNEINIFFSMMFSLFLATMAFMNCRKGFVFLFLGIYYIGMAVIRFINYYLHRRIKQHAGDNRYKENRWSSFILLFDAVAFATFSIFISIAAIAIMQNKINADTNLYLFLFYIVPLGIFRFITAIQSAKRNRRARDTYKLGLSLSSLIASIFSILEIFAILCHTWQTWAKVVIIIILVIAVEIAVLVVCVIFLVHFFRSLIINNPIRERKEKRRKAKEIEETTE